MSQIEKNIKKSIFSFTIDELREYMAKNSFAKYSADQIYNWIYKKFVFDLNEWNNVSKKVKSHLVSHLDMHLPTIVKKFKSSDGTIKFLLEMQDKKSGEIDFLQPGKWAREVKWSHVPGNLSKSYINIPLLDKKIWIKDNFLM